MRHERFDIRLLLSLLLIFGFSVGLIYGADKKNGTAAPKLELPVLKETPQKKVTFEDKNALADLTIDQAVDQLDVFAATQDIEKMIEMLVGLPLDKMVAIAKAMINDKESDLSRDEKLLFLYGLALKFKKDPVSQYKILDLIADSQMVLPGKALLLVAAQNNYPSALPMIVAWAKEYTKKTGEEKTPREIALLVQRAMDEVVDPEDDPLALGVMFKNGVEITPERASLSLWMAVDRDKKPEFVKVLIDHNADINYARKGYSLLMKAVENENEDMVHALVEIKPDKLEINAMHKPAVGTALQLAIQHGLATIDEYLREHGARENDGEPKKKKEVEKKVEQKTAIKTK